MRAGEVSSRELVELYLERIARLDPQLRAYRVVLADEALAAADAADARRAAGDAPPLNGVPIAIKDDTDVAGEVTMRGSLAHDGPARARTPRSSRRLRAAGCVILGKTHVPGARGDVRDRVARLRRDAQPVGPGADLRRLERRLGHRGRRRARRRGAGDGRRGLDPHPGRGVRAVRAEAAARPAADARGLERAVGDGLPHARRARHGALRRRGGGHGLGGGGAARAGAAADRALVRRCRAASFVRVEDEQRAAVHALAERLRGLGHDVAERDPGLRQRRRPRARPATCTASGRRPRGCRTPSGSPAGRAAWPRWGPSSRARSCGARSPARRPTARGRTRSSTQVDVLVTPTLTRRPPLVGEWGDLPAPVMLNGMVNFVAFLGFWNHTGQPAASVPSEVAARRLPGRRAARRPPGRRGDAALARGAARGGLRLGGAPAAGRGMSEAELLDLAVAVAHEAGAGLREAFGSVLAIASKSTPTDLVSEADVATEALIRERLVAARPDDAIMGEEGDDRPGTSGLRWVVDPLDGTVNFLYGIPQWCVSIAVEDADGGVAGVVVDAMRGETWTATRSGPPAVNGEPVHAAAKDDLATALVATGFGYDARVREIQAGVIARLLPQVRDIRRHRGGRAGPLLGRPPGATTRTSSAA